MRRTLVDGRRPSSVARTVAQAATRAAEDLREYDDPAHRDLLEDLDRLRDSVNAELRAADA